MLNMMVTCDQCTLQMDADAFLRDGILVVQKEDPLRFSFRTRCSPESFKCEKPNHFCTAGCASIWVEKKLKSELQNPVHIAPGKDIFDTSEPAEKEEKDAEPSKGDQDTAGEDYDY